MKDEEITNEDLGYCPFFASGGDRLGLGNLPVARVIAEHKEAYKVKNADGEYLARITGRQIFNASSREDYPAVGDWVVITELGHGEAVIRAVLPRLTVIKRRRGDKDREDRKNSTQVIAANIDVAFVVESADRDYNLNRFDRYFALIESGGARPAVILNKIDLLSDEESRKRSEDIRRRFPGIDVIHTSVSRGIGLDELKSRIVAGKTYCFLGSSGVGKSSLINELLGESRIRTGDISSYSDRGKHTTTSRQMYFLESGGIVIDNPGMREVDVTESARGVDSSFDEIAALAGGCRYADCAHTHEDDCAVIRAVRSGELEEDKYSNFLKLKKESKYCGMSAAERREKDRRFGKFIKRAKKDLEDLN